jgi:hypothetical protein
MDESFWVDRAQSAEAKIKTLEEAFKPAIERVKAFKANFGVREDSGGGITIDFDKFVENLGPDGALELRKVIDEKYQISGEPGEKPRMRLVSG